MFIIKLRDTMPIVEARYAPTSSIDGIRLATAQSLVLVCQELSPDSPKNVITICGKKMN